MIKYIAILDSDSVTLDIMGRKKTFTNNEEVTEDTYTKTYPQHFRRLGKVEGYSSFLSVPNFIPDKIEEFVQREKIRKSSVKKIATSKKTEVEIDEIAEAIDNFVEDKFDIDMDKEKIIDLVEDEFNDEDVKVETEED